MKCLLLIYSDVKSRGFCWSGLLGTSTGVVSIPMQHRKQVVTPIQTMPSRRKTSLIIIITNAPVCEFGFFLNGQSVVGGLVFQFWKIWKANHPQAPSTRRMQINFLIKLFSDLPSLQSFFLQETYECILSKPYFISAANPRVPCPMTVMMPHTMRAQVLWS